MDGEETLIKRPRLCRHHRTKYQRRGHLRSHDRHNGGVRIRGGAARDGPTPAGGQTRRGRPWRAAHPAAGRLRPRRGRRGGRRPGRRGGRPRSATCSPRSPRAGRPTGWSPRSPGAGSRCAPTAGCGPGSCAGAGCPTPGCWACSRIRATPGRTCTAATPLGAPVDPDGSVHTGLVERPRTQWPVLIRDHHDGYIGWADYLANEARLAANRTNTGARPPREGIGAVSGHHRLRVVRQTDAHQLPHRSAPRLRVLAPRRPADHPDLPLGRRGHRRRRGRRPAAGRAEPDTRSRSRWPPPTRSPTDTTASVAPPNSPSNAPATRPTAPNAPSTPSSPKTVWSHGLWKTRWETKLAALAEAEQALAGRTRGAAAAAGPGRARTAGRRPARALARTDHQQQGP